MQGGALAPVALIHRPGIVQFSLPEGVPLVQSYGSEEVLALPSYGGELVVNGDFSNGFDSWYSNFFIPQYSAETVVFINGVFSDLGQDFLEVVESGKQVRVTIDRLFGDITGDNIKLHLKNTLGDVIETMDLSGTGAATLQEVFALTDDCETVIIQGSSTGYANSYAFDNVSVKEVL